MARPYDFLTLSPAEARLIVAALNGHVATPGIPARDELALAITDSCGPDAEGERLDTLYGVRDWRALVARISALSDPQAADVLAAATAFWSGDHGLYLDESLQRVGLL